MTSKAMGHREHFHVHMGSGAVRRRVEGQREDLYSSFSYVAQIGDFTCLRVFFINVLLPVR